MKTHSIHPVSASQTPGKPIVVMELFTSQGCSSCPPADALLATYADGKDKDIIPLSFHVDYWNRLGWKDPFSKKEFSERQEWYSRHLPNGSVYTPQLLVNGRGEAVGNNSNAVRRLVQNAQGEPNNGSISIEDVSCQNGYIHFHYSSVNIDQEDILNIALIQKKATTRIKAGENNGVIITNHNIVCSFSSINIEKEGTGKIELPASFKSLEYGLVIYSQNKNDLRITSACMKELQ